MSDLSAEAEPLFNPTRGPGHDVGIDESMIHRLIHGFYATVRADPDLGPIFDQAIGEHWDPHLAKMCDFWSSVTLGTSRYKGHPMLAHVRLPGVAPAHFTRWLALFRAAARDLCPPEAALLFIDRAERIARSLQMGIAYQRGDSPEWQAYRV